jgi:hypothetical protein
MTRPSIVTIAAILVAVVGAAVVAIKALLRVPGIPYNARELFLDGGSTTPLVFFALALLWIGAGAMFIAHLLRQTRRTYLVLPLALIAVSLVSKMLLSRSVTYESVDDIIGSNTLFELVTQRGAWGESWKQIVSAIGPNPVDFLERRVRYTALYSMPLLAIALSLASTGRAAPEPARKTPGEQLLLILCVAGWFWLARTLVITWAATDNLTELVVRRSWLGMPGEWFLVAIPAVLGVSVAQLIRAASDPKRWPAAIAAALATLPIGWTLLMAGLEPRVEKYGHVFSGAQFLLGPDRGTLLSNAQLFVRWTIVQSSAVVVTFVGAWIADAAMLVSRGARLTVRPRAGGAAS